MAQKTRGGANRLKQIADEMGEPIEELIPRMVKEEGSIYGAATALGVTRNAVNYWIKKLGYETEIVTRIRKPEKA